jgi:hypothetical protein
MNDTRQKSVHSKSRAATFRRDVADWVGRKAPAWAVEAAVEYFVQRGRVNDQDIGECAKLTQMIFAAQAESAEWTPDRDTRDTP